MANFGNKFGSNKSSMPKTRSNSNTVLLSNQSINQVNSPSTFNFGLSDVRSNNFSNLAVTPELNVVPKNITVVTWKINNFSSLREKINEYLESPTFTFANTTWILKLYPRGLVNNNSGENVGVYLMKETEEQCIRNVSCKLCLINEDNSECNTFRFVREYGNTAYGPVSIIKREELIGEKKNQLLPSEILTVCCELQEITGQASTMKLARSQTRSDGEYSNSISSLGTLSKQLEKLYESKQNCDSTLIVKEETFPVHKTILMARSNVFSAMFLSGMAESRTNTVIITDIEPSIVDDMIRFVYTGEIRNMTVEKALELYVAADKFDLDDLKCQCRQFILVNISEENVCDVAVLASNCNDPILSDHTETFIKENTSIIFSNRWRKFLEENPRLASNILQNVMKDLVPDCGIGSVEDD